MKKIERTAPPHCLNNGLATTQKKKVRFYQNLRDKDGNIRPRWSNTCKKGGPISLIRIRLLSMSNHCCVFCGINLNNSTMDVDHYLPSSQFPYLAYCWENLLPTCKRCNQNIKHDFTPTALENQKVVEAIVAEHFEHDYVYNKERLLSEIAPNQRLIDPTFDDPAEHLTFNPEFYSYEAKTDIGNVTINKFFKHKKVALEWEKISMFIKGLVLDEVSEERIHDYINLHGHEHICLTFYDYWLNEKRENRIT